MKRNSFGLFLMFLLSVVSVEYCSASEQLGAVQEVQRCSICWDLLVDPQPTITLGCPLSPHNFHRGCIISWFQQSQSCPLCRHVVEDLGVLGFTPQEIADINQDADVDADHHLIRIALMFYAVCFILDYYFLSRWQ